jgi:hypothetical protein
MIGAPCFSPVSVRFKRNKIKEKSLLEGKVLVIDPVPLLPIGHGGKRIVRFLRGAENPYERRNGDTVR